MGTLINNLSPSYCTNQYGTPFARSWAAGMSYPGSQGPGLTGPGTQSGTDLNAIAQMDPFWDCTYQSGETSAACNYDSNRYTQVEYNGEPVAAFSYNQAAPGGQPSHQGYMQYITTADTEGQSATNTYSETFGFEASWKNTIFGFGYGSTTSQSQTETTTNEWNNQFMSSTTASATDTIYEAPCNVVNGNCSPNYPPGQAYQPVTCSGLSLPIAYGQGTSFLLYQDNLFGTFMMLPESY